MFDDAVHTAAPGLEELIVAARSQLDADATRLARALRAVPAGSPNAVTAEVYSVIAAARRHCFAWFAKIRSLETEHPARADALSALSTLGAALGSWYRALRSTNRATQEREQRQAHDRFATAARILERVDAAIGGGQ